MLDFGLAKLASDRSSSDATNIETVTEPITKAGAVLGTLYYMAPEQVEAKQTDERSDIFSFGIVFYEMITGQRPFTGDTPAAVLAALLKDQPPPMSQRQPAIPRAIERIVRKCLEKKPEDRWQSARDLKPTLELIDLDAPPVSTSSASVPIPSPAVASKRGWLLPALAVAALLILGSVGWTYWSGPSGTVSMRVTRFEVGLPPEVQVNPNEFFVRISPDGAKLAFTSVGEKAGIWIRDLDSVEARLLPGTAGARAPFWSPDSKSIAYATGSRMMRVEVAGGPPQLLCESQTPVGSGVWTRAANGEGQIFFGGFGVGPIQRVAGSGGVPVAITKLLTGEAFHSLPTLLPDGRTILYLSSAGQDSGIFARSLDAKPEDPPLKRVASAQFGATFAEAQNDAGGVLFFVRDGTLMAQSLDVKTLSLVGEPVPVVQQIGTGRGHAHFSVTSTGVLAYRTGAGPSVQLRWLDRKGAAGPRIGEPGKLALISASPDESQIALFRSDTNSNSGGDIWLLDLARNVEARLTTGQSAAVMNDYGPIWSPDGKQLAYASGNSIYVKDTGGATESRLVKDVGKPVLVTDWTKDGRFLLYETLSINDLYAIPAQGGEPVPVLVTESNEFAAAISPDGHWVAYSSDRSGRSEVYIRPFAAPGTGTAPSGPVIQVSADGGAYPKWRTDGKELFFRSYSSGLMSVTLEIANSVFRPSAPVALGIQLPTGGWSPNRTAQQFLMAMPLDQGSQTPITVVTNWEASLKRN